MVSSIQVRWLKKKEIAKKVLGQELPSTPNPGYCDLQDWQAAGILLGDAIAQLACVCKTFHYVVSMEGDRSSASSSSSGSQ